LAVRVAAAEGNGEIIDFLYKSLKRVNDDQASDQIGPLISGRNAEGKSPLHLAVEKRLHTVADLMLKIDSDDNISL
jgi:ankyrin repeat protein